MRSGDQSEPRRLGHREAHRAHAGDALQPRRKLGVDDEVAAEHDLRLAAGESRAQTQLADPKDAPRIFASTCSACHKSPQGLAKSGQVAGFLRQHYTTGPEMSAAMAAYLVAAGSPPAKKDREKAAAAGQSADPAAKGKMKKQEQAATQPGVDAKDQRTLRGKQLQAKSQDADRSAHPAPGHPSPASAADAAARQATVVAPAATPAAPEQHAATPAPEPGPPLMTLDIPLPEMPTAPPADLNQSVFTSSPVP